MGQGLLFDPPKPPADDAEKSDAIVSKCGRHRLLLTRRWGEGEPLVWVMLNPSTADAKEDDPTIRRVRGFTKREGYPAFSVVNVWPLRATDPKDLHARRGEIGELILRLNLDQVTSCASGCDVVVAWGANVVECPTLQKIILGLRARARSIRCLGRTKAGYPRHPLMLRKDAPLEAWTSTLKGWL